MRGLQSRLEGRRIVSRRRASPRPALGAAARPGAAADRRARHRLPPARQIHPDAAGRRRFGAAASRHVGPHGARPRCGRNQPTLHEHLVLETDDGWRLGFVDPRRFGSVDLVPTAQEDAHRLLAELGPEPLERRSRRPACRPRWPASARRSRPRCWTRRSSPGWATSMSARRCSAPRSVPLRSAHTVPGRARGAAGAGDPGHAARGDRRGRVLACATTCSRTASWAISSTPGRSMAARASPASAARASRRARASAASRSRARSTFYCPRTQR